MEYVNNVLTITLDEWLNAGLSLDLYKSDKKRGYLDTVGRGGRGNVVLIKYDSIQKEERRLVLKAKYGNIAEEAKKKESRELVVMDGEAMTYYSTYRLKDNRPLPPEAREEYVLNASVLNAIHAIVSSRVATRRALGGKTTRIWDEMGWYVDTLRLEYPHTLPVNPVRLKEKYKTYLKEGYYSLIHRGFCNSNSRKVDLNIERLILSLYCLPSKPYAKGNVSVHDMYLQFLSGALDVYDVETGEVFDRNDYYDNNGVPVVLSESTIWRYIRDPKNAMIVDKVRNGSLDYNAKHRPHHMRKAPMYALSKISMDDRDLPRKMLDGTRVKAYYAYDVTSGCVIGASYSKLKTSSLFIDCIRDMFRTLERFGLGVPMEVEVEHHIVSQFRDDLMKAGVVFPFVRWCAPGNSQEKRAEHFNRVKKYGYEKKYQEGIGRFYAKLEANRPKVEKVASATNDQYNDKRYEYEQLIADDREVIERYNNDLHPDQKLYKGLTRLQVLHQRKNPNLSAIDKVVLYRYIGEKTNTSVKRSQSVTVQGCQYQLSSPAVMDKLSPNSYEVQAYWLYEDDGTVPEVYVWQGENFICRCEKIERYNEATAEQTDDDIRIMTQQAKYVAKTDKMVKDGKDALAKVGIITNRENYNRIEVEIADVPATNVAEDFDELLRGYDEEYDALRATNSL